MSGLREVSRCVRFMSSHQLSRPVATAAAANFQVWRRCASTAAQDAAAAAPPAFRPAPESLDDLEALSSLNSAEFGTEVRLKSAKNRFYGRKRKLPGSRYQYHPPRYNRGPLHPIQSPPSSDPIARDFVPGPFGIPRLRDTYETTYASDIMTMVYQHHPPGEIPEWKDYMAKYREWDDSSPYHKNRPARKPRGASTSRMEEHEIGFHNVPKITEVVIAIYDPLCVTQPQRLQLVRALLQAVSGVVPEISQARHGIAQFGVIKGRNIGAKATITGEAAYDFLDKCVNLVFPRIKEWPGIKGSTGDNQGNIAFGLKPNELMLFPEAEANYSFYPPKMVPGCRIFVKTTARSNRHARLLMQTLGMPFFGPLS